MDDHVSHRKALAKELFQVTGEEVPINDPIVTGALFFSHKLGEAGRLAADEIRQAGEMNAKEIRQAGRDAAREMREAAQRLALDASDAAMQMNASARASELVLERLSEERAQMLKSVQTQFVRHTNEMLKRQSSQVGVRYVPAWYALAGAVAGAALLAGAAFLGAGQNGEEKIDAAVGRSVSRAMSTMDPKRRQQLLDHIQKNP